MELYVAYAMGITDIDISGFLETTKPLDIFLVKPVYKKSKLGKNTLVGYEEVLTGKKIINIRRVRVHDILYSAFFYKFKDSAINGDEQIGDILWDVVENTSADRLLTSKELEKYMSFTPEKIHGKLRDVRKKACKSSRKAYKSDFQKDSNPIGGEFLPRKDEVYIAHAKAITDVECDGFLETTKPLDIFLVKPVYKKSKLGKDALVGYEEILTGEKIINIRRVRVHDILYSPFFNKFKDSSINGDEQIGDILWDVVDTASADRFLKPKELKRYKSFTPEEIYAKLNDVRKKARKLNQKKFKKTMK